MYIIVLKNTSFQAARKNIRPILCPIQMNYKVDHAWGGGGGGGEG